MGALLVVVVVSLMSSTPSVPAAQGVVVVEAAAADEAESGLRPGDRLVAWRREARPPAAPEPASGPFESPFDLRQLELEQLPRGKLVLVIDREGSPLEVVVPPGASMPKVRPGLTTEAADRLRRGLELLKEGQGPAGIEALEELVPLLSEEEAGWVLFRGARVAASVRLWTESERLFVGALERLDDPAARAQVEEALGDTLADTSRLDESRQAYVRALEIRHELVPGSLAEAASSNDLGRLAFARGDLAEADERFSAALAISEKLAPGSLGHAANLNNVGLVARNRGDLDRAERLILRSLAVYEELVPGGVEVSGCLGNLGIVAYFGGDLAASEGYFRRALEIRERIAPGTLNLARSLENLANVAADRGDLVEVDRLYRRSLAIKEKLAPDSLDLAGVLNNLGLLAMDRGDLDGAQADLDRSLAIKEKLAPDSLDLAATVNNLARIALERGDLEEAERLYRRSMAIKEKLAPHSLDMAVGLSGLARAAWSRGELERAAELYGKALALKQELAPAGLEEAATLANLGEVTAAMGELAVAEERLRNALAIQERVAPGTAEVALMLHRLAKTLRAAGRNDEALRHLLRAVETLEAQEGRLGGGQETRSRFRARHMEVFQDAIDLLLEMGRPEEAFHLLERSRAQGLLAMLAERELVFAADMPPELERRRRVATTRSERVLAELAEVSGASDAERLAELLSELEQLRRTLELIRGEVRAASPRLAALQYPEPLDLAGARAVLEPGTVALAWSVGRQASHLFVLGPHGEFASFPLAADEQTLRREVARFRAWVETPGDSARLADLRRRAQELTDLLLGPAAESIARARRLVLVPDGPLHLLPFAALGDPCAADDEPRWLAASKPLSVVASITLLGELRSRPGRATVDRIAAFGDPAFDAQAESPTAVAAVLRRGRALEPLASSRQEVENLARMFPERTALWLGADATESRAKSLEGSYQIIHFATHALMDERYPLESALVLAAEDDGKAGHDNGLLQVWEVLESLRLDADLVTLSACSTGLGEELAGEGLIGLTRAFQHAGARSVLASLWEVSDQSTAELMTRFYAALSDGMDKDEALRVAQMQLIAGPLERADGSQLDATHPFHWAGFELNGAW